MSKKINLRVRAEQAVFTLLGLSCHVKDYRISFLLNKGLGFKFEKMEDLSIIFPGGNEQTAFSLYFYNDEDYFNKYYLVSNRSQDIVLAPEVKQVDYLLIIDGELNKSKKDHLLKNIREIPGVMGAFEVRFSEIRNHENLLNDIEMHFMKITKENKLKYQPKN